MPICKKIRASHRKVCVGDMRWLIDIYNPHITPPQLQNGVDYTITKVPQATVFSAVKTYPDVATFDGINTSQSVSHEFFIRYRTDVTKESDIRYPSGNGLYYQILYVENFENRNEFLLIRCSIRGTEASS